MAAAEVNRGGDFFQALGGVIEWAEMLPGQAKVSLGLSQQCRVGVGSVARNLKEIAEASCAVQRLLSRPNFGPPPSLACRGRFERRAAVPAGLDWPSFSGSLQRLASSYRDSESFYIPALPVEGRNCLDPAGMAP